MPEHHTPEDPAERSRPMAELMDWLLKIAAGVLLVGAGAGVTLLVMHPSELMHFTSSDLGQATAAIVAGLVLVITRLFQNQANLVVQRNIARVEQAAREKPEEPKLAWDVARVKLESYLDRNLSQQQSIFWLTLVVMAAGFGIIVWGLYRAFQAPADLPVAVIGAASGVLVSFIGGSFLLIYRGVMEQSKGYVAVLERINAVGMAIQVLSTIPDTDKALRSRSTAALATQLLQLYAAHPAAPAHDDAPADPPAARASKVR